MRRAFLIGAIAGALVFVQAMLLLRVRVFLPVRALELWALAWSGIFGLTIGSTFANAAQAARSLAVAAAGLMLWYGIAAVMLRAGYRRFRVAGVAFSLLVLVAIHVWLYWAVLQATPV